MIDTQPGALTIVIASLLWFSILGCNTNRATVHIVYRPPPASPTGVADSTCGAIVGMTHIHPGWQGFQVTHMNWRQETGQWEYTSSVPMGEEQSFRINDTVACDRNETGAITEGITVNGVPLNHVVGTPGSGIEPGLAFTVDQHGQVIP